MMNSIEKNSVKKIIVYILLLVYLTGCRDTQFNADNSWMPTNTSIQMPGPSITVQPQPTITSTPIPTISPTITLTPTAELFALEGTPLPDDLAIINSNNGHLISALSVMRAETVNHLKWLPDSTQLAVGLSNGIAIYNRQYHTRYKSIYTGEGLVDFDFSPSGRYLATAHLYNLNDAGFAGNVQVWVAPQFDRLAIFGDYSALNSLSYMPNGSVIALAYTGFKDADNRIEFRNTSTWEITRTIQTGPVLTIAFSSSGSFLASIPDQYAVKIWDLENGDIKHTLHTSFTGATKSIAFSPDGKTLASGHYDGMVRIWDIETGMLIKDIQTNGVVESLEFNSESDLLAAGLSYSSSKILLWAVSTGELLNQLTGHTSGVEYIKFSPDKKLLASGSYDGSIWLWGIRP